MSVKLSFVIQGVQGDEPVTVSVCGHENQLVERWSSAGGTGPGDPEDRDIVLEPDDPEDRDIVLEPDDPEDRDIVLEPDDPEDRDIVLEPDDPWDGAGGTGFQGSRGCGRARRAPPRRSVPRPAPRYSGAIVVRLSPLVPVTHARSLRELAKRQGLDGLQQVLKRFHNPHSERSITTPNAERPLGEWPWKCKEEQLRPEVSLEDLEEQAARSALGPKHSLRRYWRVAGPTKAPGVYGEVVSLRDGLGYSAAQLARSFVKQLNALPEVDLAYRELAASDPADGLLPSVEELSDFQLYMDPSPLGLDARWARAHLNGSNDKIVVADLEQGWIPGHKDLQGLVPSQPVGGDNRHGIGDYRGNHGTAVVSELVGKSENRRGIVGIAAGAGEVVVASHFSRAHGKTEATNGHVADAIVALMTGSHPSLGPGDVLLLEVEKGNRPTEIDPLDFDAIRLAVANGVTVIEAAGNGGYDLDRLPLTADGRSLSRNHTSFRDSGAILVGAAGAALPHNRRLSSNYGSRIDCFAWGNRVVAAGYGDYLSGDERETYTDGFSGTSAAAPMIAGAAVLLQRLYQTNAGPDAPHGEEESWKRLSPRQMRSLLSDPGTGTRQGRGVRGHIGVMPDLRAILERLGLVPRVYLRDFAGDTGETPYLQRTCASPDIIVADGSTSLTNLGEGSDTVNNLGFGLVPAGSPSLFVRMRNRGLREAKGTNVTVYASRVSTLVLPHQWKKVGDTVLDVPPGDTLRAGKVKNPECDFEGCALVAVAENAGPAETPVPCTAFSFHWQKHLAVLRAQGQMAIRNVHALGDDPLPFEINGTPDAPRSFELEVLQRLPSHVTVVLTAQLGLALKFSRGRLWQVHQDLPLDEDKAKLYLPKLPSFRLGRVTLPAGVYFPCQFELQGGGLQTGHSLAIRQLYRGREVGRITWYRPS